MSNYCISCVYSLKHGECDVLTEEGKIQDAYAVGKIENNEASRSEYAKALNKALLEAIDSNCDCDCCTKCITCGEASRTREEPECPDCREGVIK